VARFSRINKDKTTPQIPIADQINWVTVYSYECVSSGIINNRYSVSLKGDLLFEISCQAVFIEQLVAMLNGAYNIGMSDSKLEEMFKKS